MLRSIGVAAVILGSGLLAVQSTGAASRKTEKPEGARDAVAAVLRSEVNAEVDRRQRLAPVLAQNPDSESVRWQSGFVRDGKTWRSFDAAPSAAEQVKLEDYRAQRVKTPMTAATQLQLANWCHQHGLPEQERAHVYMAIVLGEENDNRVLIHRLGYRPVGNQWLNRDQLLEWVETNRRTQAALKQWGPGISKIAAQLNGTRRQQDAGELALQRFTDPAAIPAITYGLCGVNEACASRGIAAIQRIEGYEAAIALAEQAAFSRWQSVRQTAAEALQTRTFEDFVPYLIELLALPANFDVVGGQVSSQAVRFGRGGHFVLLYSYIVARETEDQFQTAVLNVVDHRLTSNINLSFNRRDTVGIGAGVALLESCLMRNENDIQREVAANQRDLQKDLAARNERTRELNEQIAQVLSRVAGREYTTDPRKWWQWWRNYTETERTGEKRVVRVDEYDVRGDPNSQMSMQIRISSCFAAGTIVWMESGRRPIEEVKEGDRVLAKDVDTGELGYKPVLYASVRAARELVRLRFGDQTITATGGHRFWVSGDGWTKARDLKPGALVHTVTGNRIVTAVDAAPAEPTYNLVVDDFHTYFVGDPGLLVQDLPMPRSTNNVVPGLSRRQLVAKTNP